MNYTTKPTIKQDESFALRMLQSSINKRNALEDKYERLFAETAASGANKSRELNSLENKIGAKTNEIDSIITLIVRSKPSKATKSQAVDVLTREIARKQRLAARHRRDISAVKSGEFVFVGTDGKTTRNTKPVERYVKHLESRISTMMRWKASIA